MLVSALSDAGGTVIRGTLNSTPDTTFTVELFSNAAADPSGHGEGETFLHSVSVTTDGSGDTSFSVTVPNALLVDDYITATATGPDGTSEFSQAVEISTVLHWQGDVDSNWSTPGNWLEDQSPINGDLLVFDTATTGFADNFTPENDLTNFRVGSLSVVDNSTAGNFSLTGNAIELDAGLTTSGDQGGWIGLDGITLTGSQTIDINTNYTYWISPLDIQTHTLTFRGSNTFVSGVISGSGDVIFDSGITFLGKANEYTGLTTLDRATVVLAGEGQLGTTDQGTVTNRGQLVLYSNVVSQEALSPGGGTFGLGLRRNAEQAGELSLGTSNEVQIYYSYHPGVGTATISGDISGTAGGSGVSISVPTHKTIALTGQNTYEGATRLSGDGTLLVNGLLSSPLTVAGTTTLGGSGTVGELTVENGATLAPGTSPGTLGSGDLTLSSGSVLSVELDGTTPGAGYDQVDVTGTVDLGNANLSLALNFVPDVGDDFVIVNNDGTDAVDGEFAGFADDSTFTLAGYPFSIDYQGGDGNDMVLTAERATRIWDGGGADANWTAADNWQDNVAPRAADNLEFPGGVARLANTNDFPAGTTFHAITLNGGGYSMSGSGIGLESRLVGGEAVGANLIGFDIALLDDLTFSNDNSSDLIVDGDVAIGGHTLIVEGKGVIDMNGAITGAGSLIRQGTGQLLLDGNNTYTGSTQILSGDIFAGHASALGSTATGTTIASGAKLTIASRDSTAEPVVVASRATLSIGDAETYTGPVQLGGLLYGKSGGVVSGNITLTNDVTIRNLSRPGDFVIAGRISDEGGGHGVTFQASDGTYGPGSVVLANTANAYSGATTVIGTGVLRLDASEVIPDTSAVDVSTDATLDLNGVGQKIGSLSGSGNVTIGTGTLTTGGNNSTSTFSGVISGSGGLVKEGTGTLTLSGANTYTGGTILSAGTLAIGNDDALGTGVLSLGNATIISDSASARTLANPVSLDGDPLFGQGGGLILTGDVTLTGDRTVYTDPGRRTGVHFRGAIGESGGSRSLTMEIAGIASVWFDGAAPNTYSGETRINRGSLAASKSLATLAIIGDVMVGDGVARATLTQMRSGMIADTAAITINANAAYVLQSGSQETIGSLSGGGTVTVISGGALTVGANDASTSFDGVIEEIAGSASLGKVGTGTFTLSGNNTYTGDTAVDSGRLLVQGSLAGDSDVSVNSDGILGGTGDIAGVVTVNAGGFLAPGTSPGILNTGSVTFDAGSIFSVELDGTTPGVGYDQLDVTGTVALGGATLDVSRGFVPDVGQVFTIIENDGVDPVTGTFGGLAEGAVFTVDGRDFAISYVGGDGNDVVLTAVPTTRSWQGDVDDNWSTPGNWLEGQAPIDGDNLLFDTSTIGFADNFTPWNDLTGFHVTQLSIVDDSDLGDFALTGAAISLDGGISTGGTNGAASIGLDAVTLTASQVFNLDLDTTITSPLNADTPGSAPDLTVTAAAALQLAGVGTIAGNELGDLLVDAAGSVLLNGPITTQAGSIQVAADVIEVNGAISTSGGNVSLTATEDITLNFAVTTAGGAFSADADSDNNGSGTFSLAEAVLGAFSEQQKVTASDAASGDHFGYSLSVSDDTAIIGAYGADSSSGSAYVFVRSGGTWIQQQKLTRSGAVAGDNFAYSVSVSGDTAIVGAHLDDGDGFESGSAFVFTRSGGTWTEQQRLTSSDIVARDKFGCSVSVSGDTIIIGAYGDDDAGSNSGSAYVFRQSGGTWTQQKKLTASDGAAQDYFGYTVSVSGDTAIVGAWGNDDAGANSGSTYVFWFNGGTWTEQQKLTASDGAEGDHFGYSLSVSGDTAIIGAYEDDDDGSESGSAYIFERSGVTWTVQQKLTASDAAAEDYFGYSVSVSGDTVIVGAHYDDDVGGSSGSAYVFARSGATWTQREKLTASDGVANDIFGISVSLSGDTAVVGSYGDDDGGSSSGSAYLFQHSAGSPGGSISTGSGPVSITADKIDLQGPITAAGQTVTLQPSTAGHAVDLGSDTDAAANTLELSDLELDNITADVLRIGETEAGPITISSFISPAGTDTLHLISGAAITQSAELLIANLAVKAGGDVTLEDASNDLDTVAINTSAGSIYFTDSDGFTVDTVYGVDGIVTDGYGAFLKATTGDILVNDTDAPTDVEASGLIDFTLYGDDAMLRIGAGANVASTGGSHLYVADKMDLQGTITAPGQIVTL